MKDLRNPIVNRVMSETRRMANDLIATYGRPKSIRIEFVRDLRKSAKAKKRIEKRQREEEKLNHHAKSKLKENNRPLTPPNIKKARLWLETKGWQIYQEGFVPFNEIFSGGWDVDHIVPQAAGGTSHLYNLVLCPAHLNRHQKKKQTPYQFYQHNPLEWEAVKKRAEKHLPYDKIKHFLSEKDPTPGLSDEALGDTA